MDDLITWMRAQLDWLENGGEPDQHTWECGYRMAELPDPCSCDVPARVLREVEAKRRLLEMHERDSFGTEEWCRKCAIGDSCDDCLDYSTQVWPCSTLRLLALPFSDRPGYQEEWKP